MWFMVGGFILVSSLLSAAIGGLIDARGIVILFPVYAVLGLVATGLLARRIDERVHFRHVLAAAVAVGAGWFVAALISGAFGDGFSAWQFIAGAVLLAVAGVSALVVGRARGADS
jgi:hypothetical protein